MYSKLSMQSVSNIWCRVSEIEHKIGAGLIEEVVQVAEGELILVEEMLASRA